MLCLIRCFCSRSHATGKHRLKVCTVGANSATGSFRSHLCAIEDSLQDIATRIFLDRKLKTVQGCRAESQGIDAYTRRETEDSKELQEGEEIK